MNNTSNKKLIKPLVIGHRGSSGKKLENTMSAFEQAHLDHADGIELDTFLTADYKLIVFHDQNTKRLSEAQIDLTKANWEDIQNIKLKNNESISLLEDVLSEYLNKFSWINIELKPLHPKSKMFVEVLMHVLKFQSHTERILISSSSLSLLNRVSKRLPDIALGLVTTSIPQLFLRKVFYPHLPLTTINPDQNLLKKNWFWKLVQPKEKIWVWNAETEESWRNCLNHQVQAIITDHPEKLISYLKNPDFVFENHHD